jgi:hypothetical protein
MAPPQTIRVQPSGRFLFGQIACTGLSIPPRHINEPLYADG